MGCLSPFLRASLPSASSSPWSTPSLLPGLSAGLSHFSFSSDSHLVAALFLCHFLTDFAFVPPPRGVSSLGSASLTSPLHPPHNCHRTVGFKRKGSLNVLTQAEKCNIAHSCTFHFCLLSKYIELALLLAPCTQRFLLNVWLYLKKMSDWATFRQNKQHRLHDQLPKGTCSLTLVLTLPGGAVGLRVRAVETDFTCLFLI